MMTTARSYIVVLYFGASAHRYIVEASDESSALSLAIFKHNQEHDAQPSVLDYVLDFTVTPQRSLS